MSLGCENFMKNNSGDKIFTGWLCGQSEIFHEAGALPES
jgi:hypothetical protein